MTDLTLPYNWSARPYQVPLMRAMLGHDGVEPKNRALCVWHRRAGKDAASLNLTCVQAHRKIATYWHMLPTQRQARKVIWEAVNPHTGIRLIDQAFPEELRESTNDTEMRIKLKCGSVWYCVGSDSYDSLVGSSPYGIIFSEYSVADPQAWEFLRPILLENGGWAIFIYTFRGKNHGFRLYENVKDSDNWFVQTLTIDDTKRYANPMEIANGAEPTDLFPVITREQYDQEIDEGMDPNHGLQEYYCSPDAGIAGSYYNDLMVKADKEGRIDDFLWLEDRMVTTIWDLGVSDDNFIVFAQGDGDYVRIISAIHGNGKSLGYWIKQCQNESYIYDYHYGPHDIEVRDYSLGIPRKEFARNMGFHFEIVPNIPLMDGIDQTRRFLGKCKFNKRDPGVIHLIDSIAAYKRKWDDKAQMFKPRPDHDWSSHGADVMRYTAIAWDDKPSGFLRPLITQSRGSRKPRVKLAVGGYSGHKRTR